PALGAALNSAPIIIVPVNMMIGMAHVRAMVHRGRWLDWICRLLWRKTECTFKSADDAANCAANNRANRSRRVVCNRDTMGNAGGDALGVGVKRRSERHDRDGARQQPILHDKGPPFLVGANWTSTKASARLQIGCDMRRSWPAMGAWNLGIA